MYVKLVSLIAATSLVAVGCGKEVSGKKAEDKKEQEAKTPSIEIGGVEEDDLDSQTKAPSESEIDSEEKAAEEATAIAKEGAGKCKTSPCFTLNDWSLDFGQLKVKLERDEEQFDVYLNGFDKEAESQKYQRTDYQQTCLNELASSLQKFAEKNPDAMADFKADGYATGALARVYDYTSVGKSAPNPYFYVVKRQGQGDEKARAEWVVTAKIEKSAEAESGYVCVLPSEERIQAGLDNAKKIHLGD